MDFKLLNLGRLFFFFVNSIFLQPSFKVKILKHCTIIKKFKIHDITFKIFWLKTLIKIDFLKTDFTNITMFTRKTVFKD